MILLAVCREADPQDRPPSRRDIPDQAAVLLHEARQVGHGRKGDHLLGRRLEVVAMDVLPDVEGLRLETRERCLALKRRVTDLERAHIAHDIAGAGSLGRK